MILGEQGTICRASTSSPTCWRAGRGADQEERGRGSASALAEIVGPHALGDTDRTWKLVSGHAFTVLKSGMGAAYDVERQFLRPDGERARRHPRTWSACATMSPCTPCVVHLHRGLRWRLERERAGTSTRTTRWLEALYRAGVVTEFKKTKTGAQCRRRTCTWMTSPTRTWRPCWAGGTAARRLKMFRRIAVAGAGRAPRNEIPTGLEPVASPEGGIAPFRPSTRNPNLLNTSRDLRTADGNAHLTVIEGLPCHHGAQPYPLTRATS